MPTEPHSIDRDDPSASGVMKAARASDPPIASDDRECDGRSRVNEHLAVFETLVAGVAHELNNPMTYALAGVDVAQRQLRMRAASAAPEPTDAIAAQALDRALYGLNRMREIVRNLITFASGDTERRSLVDVRSVLESAIQLAWHQIRHRARLEKQLAEVPPVEANPVRLGRVFLNLLVNAVEAIPEGQADLHCVRVSTHADANGTVVIEIADTGSGIAPTDLPHVFDPFFTTKVPGAGPGLGLSVAHGIVRDMGGTISVQSIAGKGTTVRVEMSCAQAWKSRWEASIKGDATPAANKATVLVIDDDPLVGDAIGLTLGDAQEVTVVSSGREALDRLLHGEHFDVILCDILMPMMTGMDLYAELVAVEPGAANSMIFMTGGATSARARTFIATVANPCIQKPIDAKELRELVRSRARASVLPLGPGR